MVIHPGACLILKTSSYVEQPQKTTRKRNDQSDPVGAVINLDRHMTNSKLKESILFKTLVMIYCTEPPRNTLTSAPLELFNLQLGRPASIYRQNTPKKGSTLSHTQKHTHTHTLTIYMCLRFC